MISEGRPGGGVDDDKLRSRERDRLHQALHEPRNRNII